MLIILMMKMNMSWYDLGTPCDWRVLATVYQHCMIPVRPQSTIWEDDSLQIHPLMPTNYLYSKLNHIEILLSTE